MGKLTQPGWGPDLRPIFTALFDLWVEQGHGRTLTDLAEALNAQGARYTGRTVARFIARPGRDQRDHARQPPLWLLLNLCGRTGRTIELRPDGIRMVAGSEPVTATTGL